MGASSANVTITAAAGAGLSASADSFNSIQRIEYDIDKEMIFITLSDGRVAEYPYDAIATVTHVITAKVATITIST